MSSRYLFTSESVSMGHPDKVADQISDAMLDHCLAADPMSRVACETLVTTDLAIVSGEITTNADLSRVDHRRHRPQDHPRHRLHRSEDRLRGRHLPGHVPSARSVAATSPWASTSGGAGDQGMMFGFACKETSTLMPLPIYLAHRLVENHARMSESGELKFVRPDAKSQVTVEYEADGTPHRIHTVVLSTQHDDSVMVKKNGLDYFSDEARKIIVDKLIMPTLKKEWRTCSRAISRS